jgi:hypothetical protein
MYVHRHIVPTLGITRLDRLTVAQVQALLDEKSGEGLAAQSVIHIRSVLRRALNHGIRLEPDPSQRGFAGETAEAGALRVQTIQPR